MSGGVDSSVAAALLKKEGYDVTGVFMKAWQPRGLIRGQSFECSQTDDRREAMRAAAHLGIPFLTFDFEKEYKKEVIDYMIAEYKAGRTPNPDVMCNSRIKFGVFLDRARKIGSDYIATGHYARLRRASIKYKVSSIKLLKGVDEDKDQSYFLWTLTQEQLSYVIFPIGEYTKPKVRELARKFGLPNAEKKDSQGLCFVGELNMKEFLKQYIKEKRGNVLNDKGEVIGYHDGASFYTLGERHGFTITKKGPNDPPQYVVAKDVGRNTITVAPNRRYTQNERRMTQTIDDEVREVVIKDVNWVSGEPPDENKTYTARFRYRQPLQSCWIEAQKNADSTQNNAEGDLFRILFDESQRAVTPGQSLVLYLNTGECLGGGIIT